MRHLLASLCILTLFLSVPALSQGQGNEWREELHTKRLADMTREELRAYKRAVEERATELGLMKTGGGYQKLATPITRDGAKARKRIPGTTIQYDSGTVTGTAGVASQMVGNRYDSALNPAGTMCCFPVEASGTITMITFEMVNTFFNSVVFSLYTDVMGTTAMQVTSMALAGRTVGLNTVTFGTATMGAYANGTFLAGIWQFDPTMTALGVDTATNGGQGFHGVSLNDGAVGMGITDLASLNAVFRVNGNVSTPVELMKFKIE